MFADMHAHYPMHVEQGGSIRTLQEMRRFKKRPFRDRARAAILQVASRLFSDRDWWSGDRVTMDRLAAGDVRLVFSVLFSPGEEFEVRYPYPQAPLDEYFGELWKQLLRVEEEVERRARDPGRTPVPRIVRDAVGLDAAQRAGEIAMVHCVEGGFHLGSEPATVEANVAKLAEKGVAYITLAHLFWRKVATNVNALPFMRDSIYRLLWRQPRGEGLSELGRAAVRAMVEHGVLVDVAHMDAASLEETLELLDEIAPGMPVICSHGGYRFKDMPYMLDERTVERIADRDGVIGLIMAQHQLNHGVRRRATKTLDDSVEVIRRHIDRIREITDSHAHVAIGTDLDGFIKPTMSGIEYIDDLPKLREKLLKHYDEPVVDAVSHGNAENVLRRVWRWREDGRPFAPSAPRY